MAIVKEVLTKENIKEDFLNSKKEYNYYTSLGMIPIIILSAFVALILGLFLNRLTGLLCSIFTIFHLFLYIKKMIESNLKRKMIFSGQYKVSKDTLLNVAKNDLPNRSYGEIGSRTMQFLCFSYQRWEIPYRNYLWSDLYKMSAGGIINTSIIGDEFFVVLINGTSDICYAYNTKFFDYKEN